MGRPLTDCEKVGTKILHSNVGSQPVIIVGTDCVHFVSHTVDGYKVLCPDGMERLLPYEKINEWEVIEK